MNKTKKKKLNWYKQNRTSFFSVSIEFSLEKNKYIHNFIWKKKYYCYCSCNGELKRQEIERKLGFQEMEFKFSYNS